MNSKKVEKTSEVGEGMLYVFFCKLLFVSGPHGSVMPIIFHQRIIICLMIVRYYLNLFVKMTVEYFCTFLLLSEVGYQSSLQRVRVSIENLRTRLVTAMQSCDVSTLGDYIAMRDKK
jgi:hypothetical protein